VGENVKDDMRLCDIAMCDVAIRDLRCSFPSPSDRGRACLPEAGVRTLYLHENKTDVSIEYNGATLSSPVHGICAAGRGEMPGSADREVRLH
jgi:hypothetical protein